MTPASGFHPPVGAGEVVDFNLAVVLASELPGPVQPEPARHDTETRIAATTISLADDLHAEGQGAVDAVPPMERPLPTGFLHFVS